jgi:hypothetical protein
MPRWMINCEEHSRLASRDLDGPLSFWDRLSARVHRWVCPPCRQFKKQLDTIRSACKDGLAEFDEDQDAAGTTTLPEDACQRMKAALREHLNR